MKMLFLKGGRRAALVCTLMSGGEKNARRSKCSASIRPIRLGSRLNYQRHVRLFRFTIVHGSKETRPQFSYHARRERMSIEYERAGHENFALDRFYSCSFARTPRGNNNPAALITILPCCLSGQGDGDTSFYQEC